MDQYISCSQLQPHFHEEVAQVRHGSCIRLWISQQVRAGFWIQDNYLLTTSFWTRNLSTCLLLSSTASFSGWLLRSPGGRQSAQSQTQGAPISVSSPVCERWRRCLNGQPKLVCSFPDCPCCCGVDTKTSSEKLPYSPFCLCHLVKPKGDFYKTGEAKPF